MATCSLRCAICGADVMFRADISDMSGCAVVCCDRSCQRKAYRQDLDAFSACSRCGRGETMDRIATCGDCLQDFCMMCWQTAGTMDKDDNYVCEECNRK